MNKNLKRITTLIVIIAISGCANNNISNPIAAGAEQTVKTQQKEDKQNGNDRSTKIEKESVINGFIAFFYCLFSSSEKCN